MTTSQPLAAILNPQSWDPDLLPPLQMDGFLTGTLLTPNLDAKWVAYLWLKLPNLADDDRLKNACAAAFARRKAIEADLQKGLARLPSRLLRAGQESRSRQCPGMGEGLLESHEA